MKKILIYSIASVMAFSACENKGKDKTPVDDKPLDLSNEDSKLNYYIGLQIANNLQNDPNFDADFDLVVRGMQDFADSVKKKDIPSSQEVQTFVQTFFQKKQQEKMKMQEQENATKYAEVKAEGEKFLAENAKKAGIKTTASGLQYEVLKQGTGNRPKAQNSVRVHYHGTLLDGTVFDSSVERGEPTEFPLMGVIPGWTEGLQLMPEGSKYRFYIPQNLAYGARGGGQKIPPYAALIFDVELLEITK